MTTTRRALGRVFFWLAQGETLGAVVGSDGVLRGNLPR
jgi:hypothetical protein